MPAVPELDPDKLAGELERLPGRLADQAVEDALFKAVSIPVARAKQIRPPNPRTHRLVRSIRRRRGQKRYRPSVLVTAGGPRARHAYNVEHGHGGLGGVRPYPYLIPAVDQTQGQVFSAFSGNMRPVYDRIVTEMRSRVRLRGRTARAIAEGPV